MKRNFKSLVNLVVFTSIGMFSVVAKANPTPFEALLEATSDPAEECKINESGAEFIRRLNKWFSENAPAAITAGDRTTILVQRFGGKDVQLNRDEVSDFLYTLDYNWAQVKMGLYYAFKYLDTHNSTQGEGADSLIQDFEIKTALEQFDDAKKNCPDLEK